MQAIITRTGHVTFDLKFTVLFSQLLSYFQLQPAPAWMRCAGREETVPNNRSVRKENGNQHQDNQSQERELRLRTLEAVCDPVPWEAKLWEWGLDVRGAWQNCPLAACTWVCGAGSCPTPSGQKAARNADERVSRICSKLRASHSSCLSAVLLQGKMWSPFLVAALQIQQF